MRRMIIGSQRFGSETGGRYLVGDPHPVKDEKSDRIMDYVREPSCTQVHAFSGRNRKPEDEKRHGDRTYAAGQRLEPGR